MTSKHILKDFFSKIIIMRNKEIRDYRFALIINDKYFMMLKFPIAAQNQLTVNPHLEAEKFESK